MPNDKVYVLHWEYPDKSAHGIRGIYYEEKTAVDTYELLIKYDLSRIWFIDPYPIK
jgi:hypothetical protein